jgi:hypothetical protein
MFRSHSTLVGLGVPFDTLIEFTTQRSGMGEYP